MKNIARIVSLSLLCVLAASAPMQAGIWSNIKSGAQKCKSSTSKAWNSELTGCFKRDAGRVAFFAKWGGRSGLCLGGIGMMGFSVYRGGCHMNDARKHLIKARPYYLDWFLEKDKKKSKKSSKESKKSLEESKKSFTESMKYFAAVLPGYGLWKIGWWRIVKHRLKKKERKALAKVAKKEEKDLAKVAFEKAKQDLKKA